jgi:hypothetical protein
VVVAVYAMDMEALWRSVVDNKYDSLRGGWLSKEVAGSYGVGVWKCIRRVWEGFSEFVRYEVGDGSVVQFWHDLWSLLSLGCIPKAKARR